MCSNSPWISAYPSAKQAKTTVGIHTWWDRSIFFTRQWGWAENQDQTQLCWTYSQCSIRVLTFWIPLWAHLTSFFQSQDTSPCLSDISCQHILSNMEPGTFLHLYSSYICSRCVCWGGYRVFYHRSILHFSLGSFGINTQGIACNRKSLHLYTYLQIYPFTWGINTSSCVLQGFSNVLGLHMASTSPKLTPNLRQHGHPTWPQHGHGPKMA